MPTPQHHLQNVLDTMTTPLAERVGLVVATGALSTYPFREQLHAAAGIASDIAAFLSCIWIGMQIIAWATKRRHSG